MAFCYADQVVSYGDKVVDLTPYINNTEIVRDNYGNNEIIGLTDQEKNDYIDGFWQEGSQYARNGIYSVPFSKSSEVLFYNATFFRKHDLPLPTKWESNGLTGMWNLCRRIKEIDSSLIPLAYDSDESMYITLSAQCGVPYTSIKNGLGSFDFNNNQAKTFIKALKSYFDEGLFTTRGSNTDNTYASTMFTNKQVVMAIGSTDSVSYYRPAKIVDEYEFDVQVAQIPQQNYDRDYVLFSGPSICLFKNKNISDEQIKSSWLFYKFITSPENSADYALLVGHEPVRRSSYETQQYKNYLAKLGTSAETLFTRVSYLNSTERAKNSYFAPATFKGSSTARSQCANILISVMKENASRSNYDERVNQIFLKALEECQKAAAQIKN